MSNNSRPEPERKAPEWPSTVKRYVSQLERERIYALQVWLRCVLECDTCGEKLALDAFKTYTSTCEECAYKLRHPLLSRRSKDAYARWEQSGGLEKRRAVAAAR